MNGRITYTISFFESILDENEVLWITYEILWRNDLDRICKREKFLGTREGATKHANNRITDLYKKYFRYLDDTKRPRHSI